MNEWLRVDEGLDVFRLHGVGGICGSFFTGIFAQKWVSMLDGAALASGAIDGNPVQIGKQLAEIVAIAAYSFTLSTILLLGLKYTPYMGLRVSDEVEMIGLDLDQFFDEQIGDWSAFEQEKLMEGRGEGGLRLGTIEGQRVGSDAETGGPSGHGSEEQFEMTSVTEMTKREN